MTPPSEAKIQTVNRTNQSAIDLHVYLTETLTPLLGKKVRKVDGCATQAARAAFPGNWADRVVPHWEQNTLEITVTGTFEEGQFTAHHNVDFRMGRISEGILVELTPPGSLARLRTDWSMATLAKQMEEIDTLENSLRELKNQLGPFQYG